jgi:muramoyltetrapeptide carboxypeptidase
MKITEIGIVAPSSKVPPVEFELGLDRVRAAGFKPRVHPQVLDGHLFFAGTDEARAQAIYEFGCDSSLPVLWSARGGYGAMRLLPLLDRLTAKNGKPPRRKLLAGFSDSTALLEYVRTRWGWSTLHAPMPGLRKFCELPENEWAPLVSWIKGRKTANPWPDELDFIEGSEPSTSVEGEIVGGNLAVWTSLVGTPYAGAVRGKIVFFEDVDESLYRVDRMVQQLLLSGALKGARAIVLGNFQGCRDGVPQMLARRPADSDRERAIRTPESSELVPLRPVMDADFALRSIFGEVAKGLRIPVALGLPVGHGPEKAPLPLGAKMSLSPRGKLRLQSWNWLK